MIFRQVAKNDIYVFQYFYTGMIINVCFTVNLVLTP